MPTFTSRAISAIQDGRILSGIKRRVSGIAFRARRQATVVRGKLTANQRRYLRHCKGVIHVGANDGAERAEYAKRDLKVLWIEPLPDAFATLQTNVSEYPKQEAVCALITDREGDRHTLHVSDHHGLCSSILEPASIGYVLPQVKFTGEIEVESTTLSALMSSRDDLSNFDTLVIDTQGAELMVLKGAEIILGAFKYIECEAADFDFYRGYPRPEAIRELLSRHGFRQIREDTFRTTEHGREFDMLFHRT
jgi:FkbM family methyltransferase